MRKSKPTIGRSGGVGKSQITVPIWGVPDMIHAAWDIYAEEDTAPGDVVIFAEGSANQKPRSFTVEAARSRDTKGVKL